eukprot:11025389-Alexandrium_andersonii.AAC.1
MSASLVGSEMCIRDRPKGPWRFSGRLAAPSDPPTCASGASGLTRGGDRPVSYTHLTLPTICSV